MSLLQVLRIKNSVLLTRQSVSVPVMRLAYLSSRAFANSPATTRKSQNSKNNSNDTRAVFVL